MIGIMTVFARPINAAWRARQPNTQQKGCRSILSVPCAISCTNLDIFVRWPDLGVNHILRAWPHAASGIINTNGGEGGHHHHFQLLLLLLLLHF